jgi:type II secretory pathway pseudopilin PulG
MMITTSRGRIECLRGIPVFPKNDAGRFADHCASARSAFTLAEVLAALVFMAILIPVALEGLSIASRAGVLAARKSEAALVAERVLNESVVTTNWNTSVQNGTARQGYRDFRWTLRNDPWDLDPNQSAIRLLSVEVTFDAQGQDHSVRMSTLVDSSAPLTPTTSQQ